MKVPVVLHASFAVLVIAAAPAQAQFGDLLKKAQDTIEEVTESSLGSVSSFDAGSVASQQSGSASEGSVGALGTHSTGNYPTSGANKSKPGSPEDFARYAIKGFSADMTADEFKSLVVKLGGTLQDRTRDTRHPKPELWAENLDLTVGGFNVEKIVFTSRKSGSFSVPGTSSRKGPYDGVSQEVKIKFEREVSGLEAEKIYEALDSKFIGRQGQSWWWNSYVATDPDTGDIAFLEGMLEGNAKGITLKYQYVEMLPPVEVASDDF